MTGEVKRCTKCGEEKPATVEFFEIHGPGTRSDGLRNICRTCRKAYQREQAAAKRAQLTHTQKKAVNKKNWASQKIRLAQVATSPDGGPLRYGQQGIYAILNTKTGQVYVGSAKNVKGRWANHLNLLKQNRHHSPRLQRAWQKYGPEYFKFDVLELVDDTRLLPLIEQAWIDFLRAYAPRGGYNVLPFAGRTFGRTIGQAQRERIKVTTRARAKAYLITLPCGLRVEIANLTDFSTALGLSASGMRAAALTENRIYKGYRVQKGPLSDTEQAQIDAEQTRRRLEQKRQYLLITPDGQERVFTNISATAREIGVHDNALRDCIKGRSRHARGYKARALA